MLDLAAEDSIRSPATYFARARAAGGDVQWSEPQHAWALLSHAHCEAAFREGESLSAERTTAFAKAAARHSAAFTLVTDLLAGWMNFRDPPAHTRLRAPVKAAFTPRAVALLSEPIQQIVDETIARFDADTVDLHSAFARPIPAAVIAALLGVEGPERESFEQWSFDLSKVVFSTEPGNEPEGPILAAAGRFTAYFESLIERERREPAGSVLTTLVQNASEELSAMELVGACTMLLFAGHETTTTLLGNSLALLLEDRSLQDWLAGHPGAWETAVDEFMRTVGPARAMPRKVARDHERGGHELRQGQTVYITIVAANHDASVFPEPGRFDPLRDPNPHLGFGWGLHHCLGANLARLEASIALRTLFERCGTLEAAGPVPPVAASVMGFGRRPLVTRLGR